MEKQKDLAWLEHLQRNSWEPEVIISGISLAFLLIIPSRLFDYCVALIQDYGLEHIPAMLVLSYFSLIISVFKIFLFSHLFLRFIWAGMLGITYAFPEGVLKEKLFKFSQDIDYPHPQEYLLKLERWCSMAYGFPISIVIPIFFLTVYLIVLIAVYLLFQLDFQIIYFIFMATLIGAFLVTAIMKKSKLKVFLGQSLNGTVGAVFQSHLGKWTVFSFSMIMGVVALPFIFSDLKGFSHYQPITNLDEELYDWPEQSRYFEEYNTDQLRFPRVWTETKTVSGDRLNLYLAHYERDEKDLPKLQEHLKGDFDTLQWDKLEKVEDTYRVFLNDSLVKKNDWVSVTSGITKQKALFGNFSISHLDPGVHEIRVEKLVYLSPFLGSGDQPRHRKRWARFVFVKT